MAEDKKGILLETGTNEFEIVEFGIGDVNYGINVAKVREVMNGVLTQCGGFVGSDTDDFEPSYTADNIDTLV